MLQDKVLDVVTLKPLETEAVAGPLQSGQMVLRTFLATMDIKGA